MLDPSKPIISVKASSLKLTSGKLKCCHRPRISENLTSTSWTPCSFAHLRRAAGDLAASGGGRRVTFSYSIVDICVCGLLGTQQKNCVDSVRFWQKFRRFDRLFGQF